ncbi:SRPBCC family protein [Microlunatus sp. GCM10028923]|uniref:SRPBCC family protein n=1 Tax=Microlunatus sp. GCM10028923 TaxID=3273400 RepID=UPI00361EDCB8
MDVGHIGTVTEVVPATAEAVWSVLTDPARIGEWSGECRSGRWLDGATGPVAGARFLGRNRVRWIRWSRPCRVIEAAAPYRFCFETVSRTDRTRWTYELEPVGTATRIRQTFEIRRLSRPLAAMITLLLPEHSDRSAALRADLVRLGRVAARAFPRKPAGGRWRNPA